MRKQNVFYPALIGDPQLTLRPYADSWPFPAAAVNETPNAMKISKPFDLGPKFVSAERALSAVRAGSRIYIGTGCGAPRSLLADLEAMNPRPADLEFVSFVTTSALPQVEGTSQTHY